VLYIVLDDVGFSALEPYGGAIEVPNIKRIADNGLMYTNFHTTALCSPTRPCLLTGRNHTTNGMACISAAVSSASAGSWARRPTSGTRTSSMTTTRWTSRRHQAPAELMTAYARQDAQRGRNDPCPCGTGRKWKHCHGAALSRSSS